MDLSSSRAKVGTLPFPVGIQQARELFGICLPSVYEKVHRRLERITISDDNTSWSFLNRDYGGDAIDLFIVFAGEQDAAELIKQINEIIAGHGADGQDLFRPEAQLLNEAPGDESLPSFPVDALPTVLKNLSEGLAEVHGVNNPEAGNQEENNDQHDSKLSAEQDPFPVDDLPPVIRDLCRGLADLHGVPVAFPAALAIAAIGGAVGKGLQVDTWRGLKTFPNVYVLAGVLSGLAKSTVGTPIFAPLARCETKHQQQHAKELPMIEAELMLVQKQIAALIKQNPQNE